MNASTVGAIAMGAALLVLAVLWIRAELRRIRLEEALEASGIALARQADRTQRSLLSADDATAEAQADVAALEEHAAELEREGCAYAFALGMAERDLGRGAEFLADAELRVKHSLLDIGTLERERDQKAADRTRQCGKATPPPLPRGEWDANGSPVEVANG